MPYLTLQMNRIMTLTVCEQSIKILDGGEKTKSFEGWSAAEPIPLLGGQDCLVGRVFVFQSKGYGFEPHYDSPLLLT